jgi:acetyl esterase/lipase/plastocyanin
VLIYKDIQYAVGPDGPLLLDVYVPQFGGPFPVVLAAAGGGWDSDNKESWILQGTYLAESGMVGFVANHSLSPPGGTQHANQPAYDLLNAVMWVRANATTYKGIPDKVGALGGSSGGELVTMIGAIGEPGTTRPDAAVSWSGVSDLTTEPLDGKVENYVGCPYADCPDLWVAGSPATYVTPSTAPTWRGNSTDETTPIVDAYRLDDILTASGVPHVSEILVGTLHGKAYDLRVWDANMAFLRTYIDQSAGPAITMTSGPIRPSWPDSSAGFTWTSPDPNATFRCSLDAGQATSCSSGQTYTNLALGQHVLTVWAADQNGIRGAAGTWRWNFDQSGVRQDVGDTGFSPKTVTAKLGSNLIWTFGGTGTHTATDSTGMGLFDSGPQPPGATYIYTFTSAGNYKAKDNSTGKSATVQIPTVAGPLKGRVSDSYLVQWASWTPPAGYVVDVQVLRPGGSRWVNWLRDQTTTEAWFTPDAGAGTYSFRARLRRVSNGKAAGYSPPASIIAS